MSKGKWKKKAELTQEGMAQVVEKAAETIAVTTTAGDIVIKPVENEWKAAFKDLESRICEIERYRNTASIEGKINAIYSMIENLEQSIIALKMNKGFENDKKDKALVVNG